MNPSSANLLSASSGTVFAESRRRASAVAPSPRDRLGHEQRRGAFVCLLGLPSNPVVVAGRIDVGRIAASVRFLLMPRWSVGDVYQRSLWRDPFFTQGLPDLRGSTAALTVDYVQQGVPSRLGFVDVW